MDFNLGMSGARLRATAPDARQDARRRMADKLLEPERMPGQISSPGAARGLVLASALKNIAGVAIHPGTPQPGTPQPGTPQPGTPQPGTPQPGTPQDTPLGTTQQGAPQQGAPQQGAPQQGAPLGVTQSGADWGQLGQWFSSMFNRQS